MIEAKGISYAYPTGPEVIHGLSLRIAKGERIVFLGDNGAGKSTLLYLLSGLIEPSEGAIYFEGERIDSSKHQQRRLREKMGFLFQQADDQILGSTVYEDISFGPLNLGLSDSEVRARVNWAMEAMGLEGMEDQPTHYLSGGQKKRLTLAAVLAMKSEIILFDEPFSSLDVRLQEKLEEQLLSWSQEGHTLVIASHDVNFAWRFASRIVLIQKGEVLLDAPPQEFFRQKVQLEKAGLPLPTLVNFSKLLGIEPWATTMKEIEKYVQKR